MRGYHKYVILLAVIAIQTCLGGIYAWSEFAGLLQEGHGLSAAQTSMVSSVCILVFTSSVIVTGRLGDRVGPRPVATAGGLLLGLAYGIAGYSGGRYAVLLAGAGVMQGLAIGCGYVMAIATIVKWFPRHKGLATGLAVAGYGLGAILLRNLIDWLHADGQGYDVLTIFRIVGLAYGLICLAAGLLLTAPRMEARHAPVRFMGYRRLMGDRRFWALALSMFGVTMPGLIIASNLKQIGESFGFGGPMPWGQRLMGETVAAAAIVVLAVGNSAGRISWGLGYDRLGGRRAMPLCMLGILLSVVVLQLAGYAPAECCWAVFLGAVLLTGFCYGGCFSIYAPRVAELYSPAVVGTIYPLILLPHGIAGVLGSWWLGLTNVAENGYRPVIWITLGFAVAGLAAYLVTIRGTHTRPVHTDLPSRIDADTP